MVQTCVRSETFLERSLHKNEMYGTVEMATLKIQRFDRVWISEDYERKIYRSDLRIDKNTNLYIGDTYHMFNCIYKCTVNMDTWLGNVDSTKNDISHLFLKINFHLL